MILATCHGGEPCLTGDSTGISLFSARPHPDPHQHGKMLGLLSSTLLSMVGHDCLHYTRRSRRHASCAGSRLETARSTHIWPVGTEGMRDNLDYKQGPGSPFIHKGKKNQEKSFPDSMELLGEGLTQHVCSTELEGHWTLTLSKKENPHQEGTTDLSQGQKKVQLPSHLPQLQPQLAKLSSGSEQLWGC